MRYLVILLAVLFQFNALATEKVSKDDLLEAFNDKYIVVSTDRSLACFKGRQNSIENYKCAKAKDVWLRGDSGTLCIEFKDRDRCGRVRILDSGDYVWGSKKHSINIFTSKSNAKKYIRSAKPRSNKSNNTPDRSLSCTGDSIEFMATSNTSKNYERFWEDVVIKDGVMTVPGFGEYTKQGRGWTKENGWANLRSSGKFTATLTFPRGDRVKKQLQGNCRDK